MKFSVYAGQIFQSDRGIVFQHSDVHSGISGTLAFCVIMDMCDPEVRIGDHFFTSVVKFILIADNRNIVRVVSVEDFVDEGNDEFGHFGKHRAKNIIKDCIGGICQM